MTKKFKLEGATATIETEIADTFFRRFLGLMGRKEQPRGKALLIAPCSSIHMCFMRFSIDAAYIDREGKILKTAENLRPWLGLSLCFGAWGVLELAAGEISRLDIRVGQKFLPVE